MNLNYATIAGCGASLFFSFLSHLGTTDLGSAPTYADRRVTVRLSYQRFATMSWLVFKASALLPRPFLFISCPSGKGQLPVLFPLYCPNIDNTTFFWFYHQRQRCEEVGEYLVILFLLCVAKFNKASLPLPHLSRSLLSCQDCSPRLSFGMHQSRG